MKEFYLNIEQIGNDIYERYIGDDGEEYVRCTTYSPTLFHKAPPGTQTNYQDIYGNFCIPRTFGTCSEAREWIKKMDGIGQEAMGMDDFTLAYISDRYKGVIDYNRDVIRIANMDIEVTAPEFPEPKYAKYPIDAITHYDSIEDKYFVFDLLGDVDRWSATEAVKRGELPEELVKKVVYYPFDNETDLLLGYIDFWRNHFPVIFTGWNVEGFDIPYVINRITNVLGKKAAARLSPFGKIKSKVITNLYGEKEIFSILGITILDYLDLYKKFSFTNQPTYNLDYIGEYEVNETKIHYDGPINKLRGNNHQLYISYNIQDVALVGKIDNKRCFIELALSMAYYSKMKVQSVMSPIKTWDAIIFNSLKAQKKVIPPCKSHPKESYPGAFVKEPVINRYKYVMSFDLTSLYPSIIRQVNISPETLAGCFTPALMQDYIDKTAPKPSEKYSCAPNGSMYDKTKYGVIPTEIEKVFNQRREYKAYMLAADRNAEVIKKILASK